MRKDAGTQARRRDSSRHFMIDTRMARRERKRQPENGERDRQSDTQRGSDRYSEIDTHREICG